MSTKQQRRIQEVKSIQRKIATSNPSVANKQRPQRRNLTLTTSQTPKRKRIQNRNSWRKNAYALCRMMPFDGIGRNTGIPDGTNVRRLLIDHRVTSTLTFGPTGAINFIIAPHVPSPVYVQATDVGLRLNGVAHPNNNPNNALYIPIMLPEWTTLPLNWSHTPGVINDSSTLFGSSKFRVVTLGYRIQYVGTTLNDSGMINVSPIDYSVEPPVPNIAAVTVYSSTSAVNTAVPAGEVYTLAVNTSSFSNPLSNYSSAQSIRTPLRGGIEGKLEHIGSDYEFQPVHSNASFLFNSQYEGFSMVMNDVQEPTTIGGSGVTQGVDANWASHLVSVTGGTSGQSFILDLIMCIEYVPQPGSPNYPLAKAGPPENKSLMQRVDNYLKTQPIASNISTLASIAKTAFQIGTSLF